MTKRIRLEVSTTGIDESLQGVSSDPFTSNSVTMGTYTGLRVPPVLAASSTPATQPRYLFMLASVTFQKGIRLLGLRQGVTIGIDANEGTSPEYPIEQWVRTPTFKFVDGNISWHLVIEAQPNRKQQSALTDATNWAQLQSDTPAMLYQTFKNTSVTPTGAPLVYFENMTAYTPPDLSGGIVKDFCGLGTFRDLRFPWDDASAWSSFGERGVDIEGGGRLSLYASVLQTNPNTRNGGILPTKTMTQLSSSNLPEAAFIQDYFVAAAGENPALGPIYWRVMGALLLEKEIDQ